MATKKRKYFRKCGCCGNQYEQAQMVRTNFSPNGWICYECLDNYQDPDWEE